MKKLIHINCPPDLYEHIKSVTVKHGGDGKNMTDWLVDAGRQKMKKEKKKA